MEIGAIDWSILESLRARFLNPGEINGPYWESEEHLRQYHATFGARIGWKWDAVWENLRQVGWTPKATQLLDWGCGSGVAVLSYLDTFGAKGIERVLLWDHSAQACQFTRSEIVARFPGLAVEIYSSESSSLENADTLCLASHVINELRADQREELRALLARSKQLVLVEPGSRDASRLLGQVREDLIGTHRAVAPCVHTGACPMFKDENTRHWCHFFARAPIEAFTDGNWARFGQMMEIDLRSLPYSFLAMDAVALPALESQSANARLIGHAREYTGRTLALSCDAHGLTDYELQKRDDKALFKSFHKRKDGSLYRWGKIENGRITSGRPIKNDHVG